MQDRAMMMDRQGQRKRPARRAMPVRAALEWAFGAEYVALVRRHTGRRSRPRGPHARLDARRPPAASPGRVAAEPAPRLWPGRRQRRVAGRLATDPAPEPQGRDRPEPRPLPPCVWEPTPARIAAARRAYLDWWGYLLELQAALGAADLARIRITRDMPPMTPWR